MPDESLSQVPESEVPQDKPVTDAPINESIQPEAEPSAPAPEETPAAAEVKAAPSVPPPPRPRPARVRGEDIDDNDRVMAALAYFLWFLGPAIILLSSDMKARPYLRYHAIQALGLNTVLAVVSFVLVVMAFIFCCIGVLLLIPFGVTIYYTIMAYQATYFKIPILTNIMIGEGWLTRP
jgi:uncharacterized membrane protein